MNISFILFVAARYFRSRRRNKRIASSVLSVAGIAVGVMTLVVVLAVMNGFQSSFIEPILEVKSYHMLLAGNPQGRDFWQELEGRKEVAAITPFHEFQAVIGLNKACVIRAIPLDAMTRDSGFAESFDPDFDPPDSTRLKRGMVVGSQLAAQLNLRVGDSVSVLTASPEALRSEGRSLQIAGVFKTGFYEIDLNWAFVSLDTAEKLGYDEGMKYGIKLKNRFAESSFLQFLSDRLTSKDYTVETWREYNKAFFGALRTEKTMMMILVGLIFVVVGFNIYNALRKSVYERMEEIATLKALGARGATLQSIFISEGFLIGVSGGGLGILIGLGVAVNIDRVFRLIEDLFNSWLIPAVEWMIRPFAPQVFIPQVSIFSPAVFYIEKVPAEVYFPEALFIMAFAVLCSLLAAYFASKRVTDADPAEIMRNE